MSTINYEELASTLSDVTLLDVRNQDELNHHGRIPGSRWVPFPEIEEAFEKDKDSFVSKYGFEKPSPDATIVTYCMMGGRAMKAYNILKDQGYTDVKCYSGSFTDWVKNGGEVLKDAESQ